MLWIISALLLIPVFIQISAGIYNSVEPILDSGGVLVKLPLPISILACFGGVLIFIDNYRRGSLALLVIISTIFVMVLSVIFTMHGEVIEKSKITLMLQVLLPMSGLLLGQMVVDREKIIAKAFFYVLILIVPAQLLSTFYQGSLTLTHNLYIFSIYQHFQYVTLIFVCAYAYSMVELWNSHKAMLIVLTVLMFVYATASISFLTIFSFLLFIACFFYVKLLDYFRKSLSVIIIAILLATMIVFMQSYFGLAKSHTSIGIVETSTTIRMIDGGQYVGKMQALSEGKTPVNVTERFDIWRLYASHITENITSIFFGHSAPLPREVKSSAHNWYIDMIYNFGLISLIPIIGLIMFTSYLLYSNRKSLPNEILWLTGIVFYLVIIDSNFKVTLRQPYPGIFAFFLWGLLLSTLLQNYKSKK